MTSKKTNQKHFKRTVLLMSTLLLLITTFSLQAQSCDHSHNCSHLQDNFTKIGSFNKAKGEINDLSLTDRIAIKNIKFMFKLDDRNEIIIKNTSVRYFGTSGWYLYTELEVDGEVAIYRKKLKVEDNEIFISGVGNAEAGLGKNCKEMKFTKPPEGCKCVEPENSIDKPEVTHRVFFSAS